jgi:hypothetical protein
MYCFFGVPIGSDPGLRSQKREPLTNPAGQPKAGEPSLADGWQTALALGEEMPAHWLPAAVARFWATANPTRSQVSQESSLLEQQDGLDKPGQFVWLERAL